MKDICRQTLEKAYLFIDGEILNDAERHDIQVHLEACQPCYERYGLEKEVTALLARIRGCQRCPDPLRTRIQGLLEDA